MAGKRPIQATAIPENTAKSLYPEPFATLVKHRTKRKLGDHFGLANFGVNLTTLAPGAISALKHHHGRQDEFVYVLSGTPTLRHGEEEYQMSPGECIGFKGGSGLAHQLRNHGEVGRWTPSISKWGTGCQATPSSTRTTIWPWCRVPTEPGLQDIRTGPPIRGPSFFGKA